MPLSPEQYRGVKFVVDNLRYNVARIYNSLSSEDKELFLRGLDSSRRLFFDLCVGQYMQKKKLEEYSSRLEAELVKKEAPQTFAKEDKAADTDGQ